MPLFIHGHHGNSEIQMRTKFHLHALRSEKLVIGKSARGNFLSMVVMEIHVYEVSAPCIALFPSLRSGEVVIGKTA